METQFNWQELGNNHILREALIYLVETEGDSPNFNQLSEATDKFCNVRLTMQVNGIPVNPEKFFQAQARSYAAHVQEGVDARLKGDQVYRALSRLTEAVDEARQSILSKHERWDLL